MQLSFKKRQSKHASEPDCLADLERGQDAVLGDLNVPDVLRKRLMELGFFPGSRISAAGCAPGGNPRIYRIDGSEVALRIETASQILIRRTAAAAD